MAKHIIESQLDRRDIEAVVAMLTSMGYGPSDQRGSVKTLGFLGLRRVDLTELAERFGFDIDPAAEAIVTAKYFETLWLQDKFDYHPETPEQQLSPRQLVAEAKILDVPFLGKSHAALSRDVGEAKALLYEVAGAAEISVTDKTLAELCEAVSKEPENGTLRTTDDAPQRLGETGDSGEAGPGESRGDDPLGVGGPVGQGPAGGQSAGQEIIRKVQVQAQSQSAG